MEHNAAAFLILLVGGVVWLLTQAREPVYEGRPLSYWLDAAAFSSNQQDREHANEVVRSAGSSAIPALLRMLQANDPPLKLKLISLLSRQNIVPIRHTPAARLNHAAVSGFGELDADARSAVPALIKIYERDISPTSQDATVTALGMIGPDAEKAIPMLSEATNNADAGVRMSAAWSLGRIHRAPNLSVPALIQFLRDPDSATRNNAASALWSFGATARQAVPALVESLNDPNEAVRRQAANALSKIDPEAAVKARINSE